MRGEGGGEGEEEGGGREVTNLYSGLRKTNTLCDMESMIYIISGFFYLLLLFFFFNFQFVHITALWEQFLQTAVIIEQKDFK